MKLTNIRKIKESEYRLKVFKIKLKETLVMTKMDQEYFKNSTKCWICKK